MKEQNDIDRAWQYVQGFDVPILTAEKREEWRLLINLISVEQFKAGVANARNRPANQLHLRPSIEAFRGYAGPARQPDTYRKVERVEKTYGDGYLSMLRVKRDKGFKLTERDHQLLNQGAA